MKLRHKLHKTASVAVLTVSAFICGCSTPGDSFFKTKTENAILSWSVGNHEQAIYYAKKALIDNPNDSYAMMVAALSYESLGYPQKARSYYEDILMDGSDVVGVFGAVRNMPAEDLKKAAQERVKMMDEKKYPFAVMNPQTNTASFTAAAFPVPNVVAVSTTVSPAGTVEQLNIVKQEPIRGGIDMLSEGDRNVVLRFLTFKRLRDEKYVTEEEWLTRRSVNLGGLLPYTLTPAGQGLDLPSPSADVIIARLNALRNALEMRAITPREHAAEREIILEALLPSNPFYRMTPMAPPQDVLDGATALRRIEMLKNLGLITPDEAKKETAAIEKLIYAKLGMNEGGKAYPEASGCIRKCLSAPAQPCAPAPVKKAAPVKKKAVVKKAAPKPAPKPQAQYCPCPAT